MEALKQKWNSRRGASILLALLFLLVCMMAAASILMAAASNAGKIQSNKEEQQKYLTLSSALTLLCDDLERVEYVGPYNYEKVTVYVYTDVNGEEQEIEVTDEEDIPPVYDRYYNRHTYIREDGTLQQRSDLSSPAPWGYETDGVLEPLRERLDYMFAKHFIVPESQKNINDEYIIDDVWETGWSTDGTLPSPSFTLELTAGADRAAYGGLADKVRIKVELRADGSILMTATLLEEVVVDGGTKDWKPTKYSMTAVLRPDPDQWLEQRLVLSPVPDEGPNQTAPIRWKLDCFVKGEEAEPSAEP